MIYPKNRLPNTNFFIPYTFLAHSLRVCKPASSALAAEEMRERFFKNLPQIIFAR